LRPTRIAAASVASLALVAGLAPAALAASWKPTWSWEWASNPAPVVLNQVKANVGAHLWVHRKDSFIRGVRATAVGPGGVTRSASLVLASTKGNSHEAGTWSGQVTLLPEDPAGTWKVSYTATAYNRVTATVHNAKTFVLAKTPPPAIQIAPGGVTTSAKGATLTVQAFRPAQTDAAFVVLTDPAHRSTSPFQAARVGGDAKWGLWRAIVTMPNSAAPGTWKATPSFYSGGSPSTGTTGTFTVQQTPTITSLTATPRKIHADSKVTYKGRLGSYLSNGQWGGLAGQKVSLYYQADGGGAAIRLIATAKTDNTGWFTLPTVIWASGNGWVTYGGSGLYVRIRTGNVHIVVQ
jgi:hypothetical protein